MNLSEKLKLNYPKTTALEKVAKEYHDRFGYKPIASFSYNGIYEICLAVKKRQDLGEIIPDEDYSNIPRCGGVCGNPYLGYFTVNFWYALFHPETIENKTEFEQQLNEFLEEFKTAPKNILNPSDELNINSTIKYYYNRSLRAEEVMEILNITRPTLCSYVKRGLIKIDEEVNGQYKYNNASVYALLDGKKKH